MANYKFVDADQLDSDLALVADSIRSKGGTSEQLAFPDGFKSAIDVISKGVTIQRETGTVSISGTDKSVECGFKPDAVFFTGTDPHGGTTNHGGVAFYEGGATSLVTYFSPPSTSYIMSWWTVTQTSTGFKVKGSRLSTSGSQSSESNRSVSYIAIKYTE